MGIQSYHNIIDHIPYAVCYIPMTFYFLIIAVEAGGILVVFTPIERKKINVIAWGSFFASFSLLFRLPLFTRGSDQQQTE